MTGEQPAVVPLTDATPVRTDIKTLGAVVLLAFAAAGGWFALRAGLADAQVRISSLETAREKTSTILQEQAVLNQRVTDSLEHIRETTDQTARDVRDMQKGKHR